MVSIVSVSSRFSSFLPDKFKQVVTPIFPTQVQLDTQAKLSIQETPTLSQISPLRKLQTWFTIYAQLFRTWSFFMDCSSQVNKPKPKLVSKRRPNKSWQLSTTVPLTEPHAIGPNSLSCFPLRKLLFQVYIYAQLFRT